MHKFAAPLALTLTLTLAGGAQAALIDHGDYTEDTATGLLWVDVTLTRGTTPEDIQAEFEIDGTLRGCRHATIAEFEQLIANAGIPAPPATCIRENVNYCDEIPPGDAEELETLINLLGDTTCNREMAPAAC